MDTIDSKVRSVIQERIGMRSQVINPEADLRNELGLDSLHMVELIVELESVFHLRISDEEAARFRKVGDVSRFIGRRIAKV